MNQSLKQKLKKLLTGLSLPQEYICVDRNQFTQPFRIYLSCNGHPTAVDITDQHLFLGYKPLLIGLFGDDEINGLKQAGGQDVVSLHFQMGKFAPDSTWRGFPSGKESVARLVIHKINHIQLDRGRWMALYEGVRGEHRFLRPFHQLVGNVREKFSNRTQGNVSLENNLYDQARIAYSIPRNISLITLSDGNGKMNMFPTDLHGSMGDRFYAGSLRIGGKANEQVEQFRRIVISLVSADAYREVYALGKNHMAPLRGESEFDLHSTRSATFGFPFPAYVQQYRELELARSVDAGIHRIHMYKTIYTSIGPVRSELSHIHMYYAQWRTDHHLSTRMLFR